LEHKANRNLIDKQLRMPKPRAKSKASFTEFSARRPGAEVLWSSRTGTPRAIQGVLSAPLSGTSSDVSRSFLVENRDLFGMPEDLSDLVEVDYIQWGGVRYVKYNQTYQGIPVFGGEMHVASDPSNVVRLVTGAYYPEMEIAEEKRIVSKKAAIETALKDLESVELRGEVTGEVLWYPTARGFVKVYHLLIPTTKPLGDWRYAINVETGKIEDSYNEMRFRFPPRIPPLPPIPPPILIRRGTRGKIYLENPDESTYLTTVMFRNMTLPYKTLDGVYTKVLNEDGPEAIASPAGAFYYAPTDTHFDEAQMYYAVERTYAYFRGLEFRGFTTKGRGGKITANVHVGTKYSNAYYSPGTGQIYFGDGSYPPTGLNDLSKEVDVVAHEFTHALIDEYRPGINGIDGMALHEGTADYFACSLTNDSVLGEYVLPGPGGIRDANNTDKYPGPPPAPPLESHERGKSWAGACWSLRKELGQEVADYLIFGSVLLWPITPSFKNAKDCILSVDSLHCGGEYSGTIKKIFETERNIPA